MGIDKVDNNNSRLVLGTAQLGMRYGIANKSGQPDFVMASNIIRTAWESGICEFDTAQDYGESEQVLGQALYEMGISQDAKIISKLNPNLNHLDKEVLSRALEKSLNRFRISCLYGLMLHREEFISFLDVGLKKNLIDFVQNGTVKHIGVSVYSPEKALQALQSEVIDIVQIPTNVLDRRFCDSRVFELAEQKDKMIYIRSIFLQGLLLMKLEEIPANMDFVKPVIKTFEQIANEFGMTRQMMALGYVKLRFRNARVIFGAETPEQVKNNISSWTMKLPESFLKRVDEIFVNVDERIMNPTLWPI
jgi:aryl-alcohol dehydrogenase-like predicted oxidoreductase